MYKAIDKDYLSLIGLARGSGRYQSYIETAKSKLESIRLALKKANGFQLVNNRLEEFLAKDWDKEALFSKYTLITKKSLAQKLEFNDEIIEITNEQARIKKATGREWIFLNDKYICSQKHN